MENISRFFTAKETAEILKMHIQSLRKLIKEGKLKAFKVKRDYRIDESDLKDFIEKGKKGKL